MRNSWKTDFDGLILRQDYLKRATFDPTLFNKFSYLCKNSARKNFFKFESLYSRISYEEKDIELLCQSFLVSYLSLYSIHNNEKEKTKFMHQFYKVNKTAPTQAEIDLAEIKKITTFLNQQCINAKKVIVRKSVNIIGAKDLVYLFATTANSLPVNDKTILIKNYSKLGYRKVPFKEFKDLGGSITNDDKIFKDKNGYSIIVIKSLATEVIPFSQLNNDLSNDWGKDIEYEVSDTTYAPENVIDSVLEEFRLSDIKADFKKLSEKDRRKILKNFVAENKDDPEYASEVSLARKVLFSKTDTNCDIFN